MYNNIYDYTDTPISAYENEDSVLVPMPLYGKEINRKFNVIPVPLVMQHENWNITSNIELLNKLRTNTKKYDFTFVGDDTVFMTTQGDRSIRLTETIVGDFYVEMKVKLGQYYTP